MSLQQYILGKWTPSKGEGIPQFNAITGELIGTASTDGLDFAEIMQYGRAVGGKALRKMTFSARGLMLKKLALYLQGIRKSYYAHSYKTGTS